MAGQNQGDGAGRIGILMATYNGAPYLRAQLDSLRGQTRTDWDLAVADDGSADGTRAIVAAFAAEMRPRGHRVTLVDGPRRGATANFLSLLAGAAPHAWLAFADQDDVWLPDRLARGVAALAPLPEDIPALYCSATWIVDADLGGRRPSPPVPRPPGFRNALVQNVAPGNTILLNRAAARLARAAAAEAAAAAPNLPAHDWWVYQLVTGAGGRVIRDPAPTLCYRQHGGNQIGANDSWRARLWRIGMVLDGRFAAWNAANLAALAASRHRLAPEHRTTLDRFAALRARPVWRRVPEFARLGLYRQTAYGQGAMWLACLLGRL